MRDEGWEGGISILRPADNEIPVGRIGISYVNFYYVPRDEGWNDGISVTSSTTRDGEIPAGRIGIPAQRIISIPAATVEIINGYEASTH